MWLLLCMLNIVVYSKINCTCDDKKWSSPRLYNNGELED